MFIKIKNLHLKTIIGIHDWEEKIDREIIINATIETDCEKGLQSDDISDTINYDTLITKIKNLIANNRFKLIEKMAQQVMDVILEDQRIKACTLEVDKVGVIDGVDSFSIIISQNNGR